MVKESRISSLRLDLCFLKMHLWKPTLKASQRTHSSQEAILILPGILTRLQGPLRGQNFGLEKDKKFLEVDGGDGYNMNKNGLNGDIMYILLQLNKSGSH